MPAATASAAEPFAHTPFDGTKKPFTVALAQLDLGDWIEPDRDLARTLAQRGALLRDKRDVVFREEPGTRAAQREVLDLVVAHVLEHFPEQYHRDGSRVTVRPAGLTLDLDDPDEAPLVLAGRLVSDDLLILRPSEAGYRLVAAVLCFPSAWSLAEKFGATLDGLHANVPGYPGKMAMVMNRIFDHLKVEQPVWRVNWSIYPDAELHHPESKERPRDWFDDPANLAPEAFVRVERQTLRRLPVSGDVLFGIRVHVDPFDAFRRHPDGGRLAASLREQILGLNAEQLAYKGLTQHRDAIARALEIVALEAAEASV